MKAKTAVNLSRLIVAEMSSEKLQTHRNKLLKALREARAEYGLEQALRDGYMLPLISESASGVVPKYKFLESNLKFSLAQIYEREQKLLAVSEVYAVNGYVQITDNPMRIDTKLQSLDMQAISNRRFLFNSQTGTLILGNSNKDNFSEFESEHAKFAANESFNSFTLGWIGVGKGYRDGVIHFSPPVPKDNAAMFDNAFATLEMFARNGANGGTVIRGFPGAWEQPLSNLINFEKFIGKERAAMDENNGNAPPAEVGNLEKNEYVSQLFSILQDNGRDTSGLSALIGHVSEMENFVKRAEDKISDMKSQLAEMKEVQNHPVKTALRNAIRSLETKVAEVRTQLAELKTNIIEGCKSAVEAFKDRGISALNNLASFFGVKKGLQGWKKDIDGIIKADDKAVARIEAFAAEYHSGTNALKNMGRIIIGREPIDAKKEAGKLAKTLSVPYKAQKTAMTGLRKSLDKAIAKLEQLESTAVKQRKREGDGRPTIAERIANGKERAEQRQLDRPTPERAKTAGLEV
jgi:hypothetical protein